MKSTPLRWSISCWTQVASSPSASASTVLPSRLRVAEPHPVGPLDLLVIFRDREAALLVGALLLRGPDDLRIDQHHRPALLVRSSATVDHDEALRHADLDRGETDAGRVVHRLEHVRGEGRTSSVISPTARTRRRKRGSGRMTRGRIGMGGGDKRSPSGGQIVHLSFVGSRRIRGVASGMNEIALLTRRAARHLGRGDARLRGARPRAAPRVVTVASCRHAPRAGARGQRPPPSGRARWTTRSPRSPASRPR